MKAGEDLERLLTISEPTKDFNLILPLIEISFMFVQYHCYKFHLYYHLFILDQLIFLISFISSI